MVFSRYAATSNEGGLMKKAIPLVMSALMATSFTGVPAIAQAKTPAARTASEKQETQYDLSNCDLRQRNYRSNFIEGNGPDKDTSICLIFIFIPSSVVSNPSRIPKFAFCLSRRFIAQSKRMYLFSAITIMVFSCLYSFSYAEPQLILCKDNARRKQNHQAYLNVMPSRSISYAKIIQGKSKTIKLT